jgi:hypothetical protein
MVARKRLKHVLNIPFLYHGKPQTFRVEMGTDGVSSFIKRMAAESLLLTGGRCFLIAALPVSLVNAGDTKYLRPPPQGRRLSKQIFSYFTSDTRGDGMRKENDIANVNYDPRSANSICAAVAATGCKCAAPIRLSRQQRDDEAIRKDTTAIKARFRSKSEWYLLAHFMVPLYRSSQVQYDKFNLVTHIEFKGVLQCPMMIIDVWIYHKYD